MSIYQRIKIVCGDITKIECDCIVNAANSSLLGGGGVDGAIHAAAGPQLLEECITLNGCRTGESKITKGYRLPAKWVIHTVGPVYRGRGDEAELLASCYRSALDLAKEYGIKSIAFPAISTGVYQYPLEEATDVAVAVVAQWMQNHADYEIEVIFCGFQNHVCGVYQRAIGTKMSEEKTMKKIASFTVNHDVLTKGMYISRIDGDVVTYDIRMKLPNGGDYLQMSAAHTLEHLFATYARNSRFSEGVIYVGPMGCRTGFYLLLRDTISYADAIELVKESMAFARDFEGEIPGNKKAECGNYLDHDLAGAKAIGAEMAEVLQNWQVYDLKYKE